MEDEPEIKEFVLQNENPQFLTDFYTSVTQFFADFGWFVVAFALLLLYVYVRICPYIESYLKKKEDEEYAAKYHKNPDLFNARLTSMEEARKKMQENYNKMVDEHKIKMDIKEEQKRADWIERQVGGKSPGNKLGRGSKDENKKEKLFKPEYNPLMGSSSGSSYRAPKKSACGGGGCGK